METETVKDCNIEALSPRPLVLNLLAVAENGVLGVPEFLRAGALFDVSENSLRVTLARLAQGGLVETVERGTYRLGPAAREVGADVAGWRRAEDRLSDWSGRWIAVATGGLPRSDRKVLRARERALTMLGMRELGAGLYVRPDNFKGGVAAVRLRLTGLGLGPEAAVFSAGDLDDTRQARACHLWDGARLTESYRDGVARLDGWLTLEPGLPLEQAARESYILGNDAIRRIVFDPMLPAPLADETARHAFIEAVKRFDDAGRRIWAEFLAG